MEQMSEQDAKWLKAFGKGQGYTSGIAVKFPLQVQIDFDKDLIWDEIGKEDFIRQNKERWENGGKEHSEEVSKNEEAQNKLLKESKRVRLK